MPNLKTKTLSASQLDPALSALFSQSTGPVSHRTNSGYKKLLSPKPRILPKTVDAEDAVVEESYGTGCENSAKPQVFSDNDFSEEDIQSLDEEPRGNEDNKSEDETANILEIAVKHAAAEEGKGKRKRKRARFDKEDDLEARYLERLVDNDEPASQRTKQDTTDQALGQGGDTDKIEVENDAEKEGNEAAEDGGIPVHESLLADSMAKEIEKANRTVFLGNVSAEAVTSSKAKKTLMAHLSSVLNRNATHPETLQSIRFRSTAFTTASFPKRSAFIMKAVMEATTKSTNAYAVYSSPAAARTAVTKLNGTKILDRHIRVDSVAHPAVVDHRRCVFVGNLGFVNDETVFSTNVDEEGHEVTKKRKRTKEPMDVEEGLWQVFGQHAGKVESVRVVRDPATRVGKGFAYVQFYDENAVESALLLAGKKFPPMLPRDLRVSRCKAPHQTIRALEAKKAGKPDKRKGTAATLEYLHKSTAEAKTLAGRASKILGRAAAVQMKGKKTREPKGDKSKDKSANSAALGGSTAMTETSGQFVFEGKRASAKDGRPKNLRFKGERNNKQRKKKARRTDRATKWKASRAENGLAK